MINRLISYNDFCDYLGDNEIERFVSLIPYSYKIEWEQCRMECYYSCVAWLKNKPKDLSQFISLPFEDMQQKVEVKPITKKDVIDMRSKFENIKGRI